MMDFKETAKKWQQKWEEERIFEAKEDPKKEKYYVLEMYPYPSSSSLHMGHARNYCIGDCYARYKRMQGFNVLYPMGYDSFGLPAENAAIKFKSHPKIFIDKAIESFIKQQKALGLSYDWSRMIMSHDPKYYKWDQWIFLKMHEKGLAYKKKASVNWCPECDTVLANEQVHDGKCWRHTDTEVEPKELNQWFFKITDYAEELLGGIDNLKGWAEDVKTMQRNWIGKTRGINIFFKLENSDKILPTYTTRCDTIYSVTYLVIAPENPLAEELVKGTKYEKEFRRILKIIGKQSVMERTTPEGKDKIGCFLGRFTINPVNNEKIPIYIANFVLREYGTGVVMADAHDQRDFEFARKYNIPLKFVISEDGMPTYPKNASHAYTSNGILFNSGEFSGMHNRDALPLMEDWLEKNNWGKKDVNYKLKDWLISRQRFWGCPIPIVYCDKCGIVPVPEKELPVKLPENYKFTIGKGNPLEHCEEFVNTKCPKCNGKAKRETDTMDTFVDSSWYFLRYCDAKNNKEIFDKKKVAYWMPIDMYVGGKEHATMHLIYFRFFTKFLRDIGLLKIDEPTLNLFNQGMLHKNGVVMSKSKGNVVTQDEIAEKYGIDTARFFLLFVAGPDKDMEWDDKTVQGSYRFLRRVFALTEKRVTSNKDVKLESRMHKTIKLLTENIENFEFNIALVHLMEFVNYLSSKEEVTKDSLETAALLINPFTPHLSEELWEKLGNKPFASIQKWPKYDEKKIDKEAEALEGVLEATKKDIYSVIELAKIEKPKKISIFIADEWKYELTRKLKKEMEKTRNVGDIMRNLSKEFSTYMKEVSKIVPKMVKDETKLPKVVLDRKKELDALKASADRLKEEFNCDVEVIEEKDSKEAKAKNAMPGKVAILVK